MNRLKDRCTAWLWCTDARGCTVSGGSQFKAYDCILWHLDMLPLARPDPDSLPSASGQDMYNHTVGFMSGEPLHGTELWVPRITSPSEQAPVSMPAGRWPPASHAIVITHPQTCTGQLYCRPVPMHILTLQQTCAQPGWTRNAIARADHLSRMSLTNKIDFARLHGVTLEVVTNPVSQPTPSSQCQRLRPSCTCCTRTDGRPICRCQSGIAVLLLHRY